jgi:hypothetical protein
MKKAYLYTIEDAVDGDDEIVIFSEAEDLPRLPEFDQYAQLGYVPAEAYFNAGWWHECHWCGATVQEDSEESEFPVFEKSRSYCCQWCFDEDAKDRKIYYIRRAQLKAYLTSKFPNHRKLHIIGGSSSFRLSAMFYIEGVSGICTWDERYPGELSTSDPAGLLDYLVKFKK